MDHPGIQGVVLTSRDVSERRNAEKRAEYLSQHDVLTGLPNRALMRDRPQQAIIQARRNGGLVALMFIDLDRFKMVNESFGHHITGDTLLKQVAARLTQSLRDTDTVARLGGDEFTVLLPDATNPQVVGEVAQRILSEFSSPFSDGEQEMFVSASIGISLFPRDGVSSDDLVKHADTAMYSAKESGRNRFRYFTEDLNQEVREKVMLESGLRRGIERGELCLHYQPKIDLATNRVIGAEALVRWQHPTRGLILPGKFILVAEESGLILPLGEWVLRGRASSCVRATRGHRDARGGERVGTPAPAAQPGRHRHGRDGRGRGGPAVHGDRADPGRDHERLEGDLHARAHALERHRHLHRRFRHRLPSLVICAPAADILKIDRSFV
jgi:diguanylate cyclase (GGDEF)-like protein